METINADDILLDVEDVHRSFGAIQAVRSMSFQVRRGSITSVIGPNGAGKSTLFNLITGDIPVHAGKVRFEWRDVTGLGPRHKVREGIARSFQITNLFFDLSVLENLRLAAQVLLPFRLSLSPLSRSRAAVERAGEMLERFGLTARAGVPAGALSHGERRRLEIAVALASRPRLLLLDEPTQGMSHADTEETEALIQSLAGEITILLIEHDIEIVMNISDHVVVMHQGTLLAEGTPQQVRADPAVQEAYLGRA